MLLNFCDILTPEQLKHLSEHKYNSTGRTLLDPLMQPFWNWLVQKFPLWLAPNTMTVVGLIINVATSFLLIYYSPDCVQEPPGWSFLLCAFGLFIYQTLDACDGKQARRTNSTSPLGELFDHGCDALSTALVGVTVCIAVQLGSYPIWMFLQCFLAITLFYCAHWQTYVSGTLEFGMFDVTEVQFSIIFIYIVSAICTPYAWSLKIPFISLELKLLPIILEIVTGSIVLFRYLTVIFTGGIGKNGSTVADTSVLSPFVPMALVLISAFTIYQKSISLLFQLHPCLYILAFGLVSAKVTIKLVVAHMTKGKMSYLDSTFIGPGLLFFNQYFNTPINEYVALWLCVVYSLLDFFIYSTALCNQICAYLHIRLFFIEPVSNVDNDGETSTNSETPLLQSILNGMQWAGFNFHKRL